MTNIVPGREGNQRKGMEPTIAFKVRAELSSWNTVQRRELIRDKSVVSDKSILMKKIRIKIRLS